MDRAERVIAFIEQYCLIPEGEHVGQPMKLADFQKDFIRDVYRGGVRAALLAIARKNGKTAIIASLLLAHLVGPESRANTQIVSGARSRDQAALVFDLAKKMVMLSSELSDIIRIIPSQKKLIGLPRAVEYKALAAESKTAHGLSPVLAILDELGQVKGPQDDFVDAITTSQGAHADPLLISISTQAPTDADLLSTWIDDAQKTDDPTTVCHVYAASEDANLDNEEAWKAANPALGIFRSIEDVREQASKAKRMPSFESTFRNLILNQRVSTTDPFVSRSIWSANGDEPKPLEGAMAWGGLDLSKRTDLTSFTLVYQVDGIWQVRQKFWAPEEGVRERAKRDRAPYDQWAREGWIELTPGATVDYEYVLRSILEMVDDLELMGLGFDRWRIDVFNKEMESLGIELPMVEVGQGYRSFSPALDTLEADLLNYRMAHGNNPVLNMCAANAVVSTDPAGNRKLDKAKANGRIDGMVSLAMARGIASEESDVIVESPFENPNFRLPG